MDYRATCAEAAAELARGFQASGRYGFFRGQTRNWPLQPSFFRLSETDQKLTKARLDHFRGWIQSTEGLEPIAASVDYVIAVAQHYGIPTTFLDFTTDPSVAAFFACEGMLSSASGEACIVCLWPEPTARAIWSLFDSKASAEVLFPNVPNLWRLEAQHGVFVHCPWNSLDDAVGLDRILFRPGPLAAPTREEIYPVHKSPLEILLDQYFQLEQVHEFTIFADSVGMNYVPFSVSEDGYRSEFFRPEGLSPLASWEPVRTSHWASVPTERWLEARALGDVVLDLGTAHDAAQARSLVATLVAARLRDQPSVRSQLVHWAPRHPDPKLAARLEDAMVRAWDGMRLLPYSDEDIVAALATCAALTVAVVDSPPGFFSEEEAARRCFGPVVNVEFAAYDNAYSRGYAACTDLVAAMRSDLFELIRPEYADRAHADLRDLFAIAWSPKLIFEFQPLTRLFARQVIPGQVVFRPTSPALFSPARLRTFGRP